MPNHITNDGRSLKKTVHIIYITTIWGKMYTLVILSYWYHEKLHVLSVDLRQTLSQSDHLWLRYGTLIV